MSAVFSRYLKLHFSNHNICFNDMEISAHVFSPDLSRLKLQKLQSLLPPPPPPSPRFKTRCRLLKTLLGGGCILNSPFAHLSITHLVCPPKFCISVALNFSWDHCNTQEKLKTKIMQSFLGGGGGGKQDVLWEMWKWRIAYGCGVHLGLVFLLEAALFLRVSNCSVIFLSFVRKLAVTKG